ncbi:hypothetical protein RZE82_09350 [Mollicutes bacterium LVI A0039]|nr:hypothetical protein RZE82_09350 [Mollicutes bacterium LVI A0039]
MDVIYCLKCHNKKRGLSYDNAKSQIADALNISVLEIEDGCPSFCGPGANHHFAEVDGEMVYDLSFDGLITKLKEF